jgi:O-antigen/teichoic acid export membrane protein
MAIINVFYNLAPQFILARVLDFNAVGLYSRAVNVTQVFDRAVVHVFDPVILPAISTHTRAGGDLKAIYLNSIELITVLQWPFLIFFALMAEPIITVWLGSAWFEIVPLIQLLCVASLFLFAAPFTYPVLVASGHVRDTFVSSLISLPPSLFLMAIAAFFGVQAVAACALLTLPFQAFVAIYFVGRHLAMKPIDLGRATLKSSIVTLCSMTGSLASMVIMGLGATGPIPKIIMATAFAGIGWWLGLLMTQHPLLAQVRLATGSIAINVLRLRGFGKKIHTDDKLL